MLILSQIWFHLLRLLHPFKIFFGCLSFVVVVVVFHSSKICIQLLPFLCGFVFVAHNESHVHFVNYTTIYNNYYYYEFRLQCYLSKHHF